MSNNHQQILIENILISFLTFILGVLSNWISQNTIILPIYLPAAFTFIFLYKRSKYNCIGIFIGTLLESSLNLSIFTDITLSTLIVVSIFISIANTLQPLIIIILLEKFNIDAIFKDFKNLMSFILTIVIGCLVSAIIGSLTLVSSGIISNSFITGAIYSWWMSDMASILIISPILIYGRDNIIISKELILFFVLSISYQLIFLINICECISGDYSYLILPFIIWSVFRFAEKISVFNNLLVTSSAMIHVFIGKDVHSPNDFDRDLLYIQTFFMVISITTLVFIVLFSEKEKQRIILKKYSIQLETRVKKVNNEIDMLIKLLPICSKCKKIRDTDENWSSLEIYMKKHHHINFTHSYCEACADELLHESD